MNTQSILILILIAVLITHLIEEVRTGFRERFPLFRFPRSLFILANVVLYLFCGVTLYLSVAGDPLSTVFASVFAIGMLLNGIVHIVIMLIKRKYFPGGITALPLIVVSILLIFSLLKG
jgi:tryptophan-rich sensory protein